jgi:hypothetical protein
MQILDTKPFWLISTRHMSLEMLASAARNEVIPSRLVLEGVMARSLGQHPKSDSPINRSETSAASLFLFTLTRRGEEM